jgi:hypothetical protein
MRQGCRFQCVVYVCILRTNVCSVFYLNVVWSCCFLFTRCLWSFRRRHHHHHHNISTVRFRLCRTRYPTKIEVAMTVRLKVRRLNVLEYIHHPPRFPMASSVRHFHDPLYLTSLLRLLKDIDNVQKMIRLIIYICYIEKCFRVSNIWIKCFVLNLSLFLCAEYPHGYN